MYQMWTTPYFVHNITYRLLCKPSISSEIWIALLAIP